MPAFTEEEKRILLQTPIELILTHFGKATEHRRGNMFFSPFREESTPSFLVNPNITPGMISGQAKEVGS